MSFETEIQRAIFERLSGFTGMPQVHQYVKQSADSGSDVPFPYVKIGDDTHMPWDTDDESGAESTIVIHSWSRAKNRSEIKAIQGSIYEALHRHELEVDGFHVVTIDFESSESFMDPDAISNHGVSLFRILLHE